MSEAACFRWPVRVYYEDTDAGGVVYHANYLCFMERARTEMLRHHGLEQTDIREKLGIVFVVKSMNIEYRRPARFNDALDVMVEIRDVRRASMTFIQSVYRAGDPDPLCTAEVMVASLQISNFRPCALPQALLDILKLK
ncbi:MAG: hypothetical protein RIQ52_2018 [Pseudomonadota bacterium]